MKRVKTKPRYAREEELCEHLTAVARREGFKVYPETEGFDLLLVAGDNCREFMPGDQIGVEAKLKDSFEVLVQALPKMSRAKGPHYYAVLVPLSSDAFDRIASRVQVTVLRGSDLDENGLRTRRADFYHAKGRVTWFRQKYEASCWVPECEVPGMVGGRFGPRKITPWKMAAVKLCLLGEERGYLTSKDFKDAAVDMRRWLAEKWLVPFDTSEHEGRKMRRYVLNREAELPHIKFEAIVEALAKQGVIE